MIVLVATLKAKSGKEATLEAALKSVIPSVEREAGTLQYILHRSQHDPGKFLFYEKYRDKASLDFHGSTPYLKELFEKLTDLLEDTTSIDLYEEIARINK